MNYWESYPGEFKAVTHYITVAKCENSQTCSHSVSMVGQQLQKLNLCCENTRDGWEEIRVRDIIAVFASSTQVISHDLESQHIRLKQQRFKCQPAQSSRWHLTCVDSLSMRCFAHTANPISIPLCYCCFIYTFCLGDQYEHHCHLC